MDDEEKALAAHIGEKAKERRKHLGLSFTALAELTGLTAPNIARLERGDNLPTLRTLNRVARAMKTKISFFLP